MTKVAEVIVKKHEDCPYYEYSIYPDWETGRYDEYHSCNHPGNNNGLGCINIMYAPPPEHCPLKDVKE